MLQEMARPATLWAAWARVAARSGMAGADGVEVAEFAERLGPRLELLSRLLLSGEYRPQPLRLVLANRAGKVRHRGVPTVADRVAQRAFLQVCGPQLEAARAEVSFAYRRGRSWVDALARAGRCRAQGLRWVFRTDIADFFGSVEHDLLRAMVSTQVTDPALVELVDAWVQAPALTQHGLRARTRGLPEGAPLSPALANLYLRRFDDQVDGRHGRLVRYADDLALFCRDLNAATAGAEHVAGELDLLRHPGKTYIATFDAGFRMLGWVFQGEQGWPEQERRGWTHPLVARPATECGGL